MDACTTGCVALCGAEVYHTIFTQCILDRGHPICELEALNAAVAIKLWAPTLFCRRIRLYSDSSTAVAILQAGKDRTVIFRHVSVRYGCHVPCMTSLSPAHTCTHTHTHTHTHTVTVSSTWQILLAGVIWLEYIRIGYTGLRGQRFI